MGWTLAAIISGLFRQEVTLQPTASLSPKPLCLPYPVILEPHPWLIFEPQNH